MKAVRWFGHRVSRAWRRSSGQRGMCIQATRIIGSFTDGKPLYVWHASVAEELASATKADLGAWLTLRECKREPVPLFRKWLADNPLKFTDMPPGPRVPGISVDVVPCVYAEIKFAKGGAT